ncbi:MAG: HDOD domain-containing protein [Deltaproteobacteria bacterium]|nr:HDOD domain-containing protein [Deltaproteobacteria bacterium]
MDFQQGQDFLAGLSEVQSILPFSPVLIRDLFILTAEDSLGSLADVARAVNRDPGLSAAILKTANSAYYGLQSQISTLDRAVSILGMKEIRTMVLFVALRSVNKRIDPNDFDLESFWRHGFAVALTARTVANVLEHRDPSIIYTAGLLHDMGKLFTVLLRPDHWRAINVLAVKDGVPLLEAEEAHWGIDHALIGALALRSWNLPDEITEPISWHHAPLSAPAFQEASAILCLADGLVLTGPDAVDDERRILASLTGKDRTDAAVAAAAECLDGGASVHGVLF